MGLGAAASLGWYNVLAWAVDVPGRLMMRMMRMTMTRTGIMVRLVIRKGRNVKVESVWIGCGWSKNFLMTVFFWQFCRRKRGLKCANLLKRGGRVLSLDNQVKV